MYDTCALYIAAQHGSGDRKPHESLFSTTKAFRWSTAEIRVLPHPKTGVNPSPLSRARLSVADIVMQRVTACNNEMLFNMISAYKCRQRMPQSQGSPYDL